MYIVYALLGAFFAAAVSILVKLGIKDVDSYLATAIRTVVVLLLAWGIVFATGKHTGITNITAKSWIFLAASGVATGLSWIFFYRALQDGPNSVVVPIDKSSVVISMVFAWTILQEKITPQSVIGGILITAGTLVMVFWK